MFSRALRPLVSTSSRVSILSTPSACAQRIMQTQKRNGHWLHKNARAEENAGLRENSIAEWKFDVESIPRLLAYLFIPGGLFYMVAVTEMEQKAIDVGHPKVFGATPGRETNEPEK